jgi:O-antigen/teichoic acid export membrane protein
VSRAPWELLFATGGFSPENFPDLFYPLSAAALVLLVGTIVLYNVQTRRLHRHSPLVALQEWLLWTGLAVFGLLLVYATFKFYFVFVVVTLIVGLATFYWIRFRRFPPEIAIYNEQLRRARSLSQERYRHPEATIRHRRPTTGRTRRRRR